MSLSVSLLPPKMVAARAARYADKSGTWAGGPNFILISKHGSRVNNGKTTRGRTRYSCGTERAYLGDIMAACYANWKARARFTEK